MKTLIIYVSVHHGNTEKIAKVMANILEARLLRPHEMDINTFAEYDLIGYGSGIYFGKHHKSLLGLVDKLPKSQTKEAFIFYTSGVRKVKFLHECNKLLKKKLLDKGFDIIGEFSCRGFDTFGPFKLIGGINKGRPNEKDLEQAEIFARGLRDKS